MRASILRRTSRSTGLAVAALTALALLVPASPASAAPTTIVGRVDAGGRALAGVAVGFTDPDSGAVTRSRTDAEGRFRISVPSADGAGFVWAGVDPRVRHVVFTHRGTAYVRGVIGLIRPRSAPGALFQTLRPGTAEQIASRGEVAFHIRRTARVAGRSAAFAGFRIDLRRGDGSLVQAVKADRNGAYRSTPVAPGRYEVTLLPPRSVSPASVPAIVLHAGRVVPLPAASARAAAAQVSVLAGRVTAPAGVATRGVRVEVLSGDVAVPDRVVTVRTGSDGRFVVRGLAAGRYTIVAGRNEPFTEDVVSSVDPTPDGLVAATSSVAIRARRTTTVVLPLGRAALVVGRSPARSTVVAEDSAGRIIRAARADAEGRFTLGGLPTGELTILARTHSEYAARPVRTTAGRSADAGVLEPGLPLLAIQGTVSGAVADQRASTSIEAAIAGGVFGYDTALLTGPGDAAADGRYRIASLVPGRYELLLHPIVDTPRTTRTVDLTRTTAAIPVDFDLGPAAARIRGHFRTLGGPGIGYLPYSVSGSDGSHPGVSGNSGSVPSTNAASFGLLGRPGVTYTWQRSNDGIVPASDGPWWAIPADRTFTIPPRGATDARIPLRIEY